MWGRFGRRRRTRREEAVEQAISALENVRGRLRLRTRRRGRPYGDAVGLGIGVLVIVLVLSLLYWRFRRTAGATTSAIPAPEEGVEATPPEREAVPLGPFALLFKYACPPRLRIGC